VKQRLRDEERRCRGAERKREDHDGDDGGLRREHAEPSLGRGQRRPDHPRRVLRHHGRRARDDRGQRREHDAREADLHDVVVAAEHRVRFLPLLRKLGLRDRAQAVVVAYESGLVVPGA
jgi:hypothetical protein